MSSSSGSYADTSALDSSFRLELIPLPVWSHLYSQSESGEGSDTNSTITINGNGQNEQRPAPNFLLDEDPRKLPMVAAITKELRRTDNILVTEIGERGLLEYLQEGLMRNSCCSNNNNFDSDDDDCCADDDEDGLKDDEGYRQPCDWVFQDDSSFRYLMEILQANMIYFLKRRYFDLERCRARETTGGPPPQQHHHPHDKRRRSSSIVEDFQTIFDKASSSRFLTHREHIARSCFKRPYQRKGSSKKKFHHHHQGGLHPKTIQSALVRLHRRAGIYLPHSSFGTCQHPSPADYQALEDGVDAYWIDLWWVCSSLLTWILEPCLHIVTSSCASSSLDDDDEPSCHPKRRRLWKHALDDDPVGFGKQSQRVAKIPFALIRAETQKLGLFYDRVLLHDGPWEEELDEAFVCHYNDNSKGVCYDDDDNWKGDSDGDGEGDSDEDSDDDSDDDHSNDDYEDDCDDYNVGGADCDTSVHGIVTNVLGETNGSKAKGTSSIQYAVTNDPNPGEGEGTSAKGKEFTMNLFTHGQKQGEEKGNGKKRKRNPPKAVSTETNGDGNRKEINIDNAMAIYNAFWQEQDENFELFCDKVVGV